MKSRTVILEKNGIISAIGVTVINEQGTLIGSYDPRRVPKVLQVYTPFDSPDVISFDSQVEQSEENGWRVIYDGIKPNFDSLMCPN